MRLPSLQSRVFPHLQSVRVEALEITDQCLVVSVSSRATRARCPLCQHWSRAIHSRFQRTVADLPCGGKAVVVRLAGHRFACRHANCPRRTFRERLPQVAPRTPRHKPMVLAHLR